MEMLGNASSDSCSSSVRVEARPGLLWASVTAAVLSGVCVALVTAALLYACHRKRLLDIRALCTGVCRRLQDQTVGVSESAAAPPADGDEPPRALSRDVAAFALKARVVYPINQRHRPLADGASNPSLHELHKHQTPPSLDSASSLTDDWLRQEREDDDDEDDDEDSSQFMSCGPSSKTHTSRMFRRVQHYPQTPFHSRVSLLSLTLQELQIHTTHLQQQKYKMFLRAMCVLLSGTENAELIQQQQQEEVESLLRGVSVDKGVEPHTVMCSVEEEEQTGREQLQHSMQTAVSFAQQLQRLIQDLQRSGVCEELQRGVLVCVRTVEDALAELQESVLQMLLDRFLCWQEVSDSLKERTALLKQEAELMLKAAGQSVESLEADGQQSVCVVETAVREALEQCANEVVCQTEDLALSLSQKVCVRRRRMMKAQSTECSSVCDTHTDARQMLKVCVELQAGHWLQRAEFEQQQDLRIIQTLCERWTSLFSECSRRVADLCSEFVLSSITADSAPSAGPASYTDLAQSAGPAPSAELLLKKMKSTVANQMQREERHAHTHLRTLREQLQRNRQLWQEGGALSLWRLLQFGDQQRRLFSTAAAQHSLALVEDQQHLLILELQRILSARCFYLRLLREMKLTVLSDTQDSIVTMETVPSEEAVIGQNPLDEQLSELEGAADVLRGHAHFLLGHALCCTVRGQSSGVWRDRRAQERLMDAVCESVYVSRDSVLSLIRQYYSELQKRSVCVRSAAGDTDAQKQRASRARALQTQLTNWTRKPRSPELQHRVVELKRVCVREIQKGHHHRPEHTHPYTQLREQERVFVRRLSSLARVSLDDDEDDGDGDGSPALHQ